MGVFFVSTVFGTVSSLHNTSLLYSVPMKKKPGAADWRPEPSAYHRSSFPLGGGGYQVSPKGNMKEHIIVMSNICLVLQLINMADFHASRPGSIQLTM